MSQHRFYVPPEGIDGDRAVIKGDEARHLVSVLRKKPGDDIVVFDGEGTECLAKVLQIGPDFVVARLERKELHDRKSRPSIALYAAAPRGRKFDLIVEKATELGADCITPLLTERTVVKLDDRNVPTKLDRWRRISVAAAKQCRRSTLPKINSPLDFHSAVQDLPEWAFPVLAWSHGQSPPILNVLFGITPSHKEIRIYVGPEGGFSSQEVEIAKQAGVRLASLGENILRIETAAIASLAAVAYFLDMQPLRSGPVADRRD